MKPVTTRTKLLTLLLLFAFLSSSLPALALSNASQTSLNPQGIKPRATVTTSERHFYIKDHLGSTMMLTDSTGEPVLDLNYEAYGEHYEVSPTTNQAVADANNFLYTGQQLDKDIGQYYLRARFYDAKLGHFTVRDPIRTAGGINMYAFVNGNPINLIDPSGLAPTDSDDALASGAYFEQQANAAVDRGNHMTAIGWRTAEVFFKMTPNYAFGALGEANGRQASAGAQGFYLLAAGISVVPGGGAASRSVVLDADAAIMIMKNTSLLKGASPRLPMTVVRELQAGGTTLREIKSFFAATGGKVSPAATAAEISSLQAAVASAHTVRGQRVLHQSDAAAAASALKSGLPFWTLDKRLFRNLEAALGK